MLSGVGIEKTSEIDYGEVMFCTVMSHMLGECLSGVIIRPLDHSPVLAIQHIATTILGTTVTRIAFVILHAIAVIVGQLLAWGDIAEGHNPDGAEGDDRVTIRLAGMVDKAGRVHVRLAVNIIAVIQRKDAGIALGEAPYAFVFGNLFATVGHNAGACLDRDDGKEAETMNARGTHTHPGQAESLCPIRGHGRW